MSACALALVSLAGSEAAGALTGEPAVTTPETSDGARPVVLVHGFNSSAEAWEKYIGEDGYLARLGRTGFALGSAGFPFELDMGETERPLAGTNSIAENAAILAAAIAEVRQRSGAQMVDIVAHSMGGLVARFYVAKLMKDRDVAQLILLGTPHGGSGCALLPAALGFYLPAALELRPSYLENIFNQQVADLRGVPVSTLAGTPIVEAFKAPCTGVPSDLVVDLDSAMAVGGRLQQLALLHTDMNSSALAFEEFVAPLLSLPSEALANVAAYPVALERVAQATHVYSGVVEPGGRVEVEIELDAVAVAKFALFDPSLSLSVEVTGASGALVSLTPDAHGLISVADQSSLVHLGYGFAAPRPGPWRVAVLPGTGTPVGGAAFALMASVVGGARVTASATPLLPEVGRAVTISATTDDVVRDSMELFAIVRRPDGEVERYELRRVEGPTAALSRVSWVGSWQTGIAGLHGLDVVLTGVTRDGLAVERTVELAVEVQPRRSRRAATVAALLLLALATVTYIRLITGRSEGDR